MKSLNLGDIDNPKTHPDCPLYLPTELDKSGVTFWENFKKKSKAMTLSSQAPIEAAQALPLPDPVGLLLERILQAKAGAALNSSHAGASLQYGFLEDPVQLFGDTEVARLRGSRVSQWNIHQWQAYPHPACAVHCAVCLWF